MIVTIRILALLVSLLSFSALASDISGLYKDSELDAVKSKYEISIQQIYEQLIYPGLSEKEKRAMNGFRFVYPLRSLQNTGEYVGYPFGFFTTADHSTIVMPVFSLKFLHDLCIAYAWLQENSFSVETIFEYIGMLKYGLPENLYAAVNMAPLKSLHIPDEALSDPKVKEYAHLHFTTARAFILAHEIGHIVRNHPPYLAGQKRTLSENEQIRRNETEADGFALDVLESTGITPLGALIFFMVDAHISPKRVDFNSEGEFKEYLNSYATHPLTPDRIETLATKMHLLDLNDRKNVRAIKALLEDEELQQSFILSGQATSLDALGPRRPDQLLSRIWPKGNASIVPVQPFDGVYAGESVSFASGQKISVPVEVSFIRQNDQVTGRYSFGSYNSKNGMVSGSRLGEGTVTNGQVKGNTLYYHWQWGSNSGDGVLHSMGNGEGFSGTWGYQQSSEGGGEWKGQRAQ